LGEQHLQVLRLRPLLEAVGETVRRSLTSMTWIGGRPSKREDNQICPLRDRCTAPRRARVRAVESHQIASHCHGVVPPPEYKDSSRGFRKGASATAVRPESSTLKTAVPPLLAFGVLGRGSRASEPSGPGSPSPPQARGREGSQCREGGGLTRGRERALCQPRNGPDVSYRLDTVTPSNKKAIGNGPFVLNSAALALTSS
jgi:hypothetical protein